MDDNQTVVNVSIADIIPSSPGVYFSRYNSLSYGNYLREEKETIIVHEDDISMIQKGFTAEKFYDITLKTFQQKEEILKEGDNFHQTIEAIDEYALKSVNLSNQGYFAFEPDRSQIEWGFSCKGFSDCGLMITTKGVRPVFLFIYSGYKSVGAGAKSDTLFQKVLVIR